MIRHRLAPLVLALGLAIAPPAGAASLTPPNLATASSLSSQDLLLVWPYAAGGPLEAMSWSTFTGQMQGALGGSFLTPGHNLSDVGNPTIARGNLGLGTAAVVNTGTSGGTLCLLNANCTVSGTETHSGEILVAPSATSGAGINLAPGTAPTSPNNGDLWTTSSALQAQVNGSTLTIQQGNWTPTISFQTVGNLSLTYVLQVGSYTKFGNVCVAFFNIGFTATYTTASGNLLIGNLPFATNNSPTNIAQAWGGTILPNYTLQSISNPGYVYTAPGTTSTNLRIQQNTNYITTANVTSGSADQVAGSYIYGC